MEIINIRHKGLRRFLEKNNPKGLVGDTEHIRDMVISLDVASSLEDLIIPPNFGLHALKGDRAGYWAMTVTRNWRLTFRITDDDEIADLNLEDYHGH